MLLDFPFKRRVEKKHQQKEQSPPKVTDIFLHSPHFIPSVLCLSLCITCVSLLYHLYIPCTSLVHHSTLNSSALDNKTEEADHYSFDKKEDK